MVLMDAFGKFGAITQSLTTETVDVLGRSAKLIGAVWLDSHLPLDPWSSSHAWTW